MDNNWYVRFDDGAISGPMTKEEALDRADQRDVDRERGEDGVDGMVFSEKIFETYHVPEDTTELVNTLLSALSDADKVAGFVELTPGKAQEIAEKLVLLSRPHELVASKEVERVLTDLRDLKTLRGGSVICQAAIILVSRLSREKAVTKHA